MVAVDLESLHNIGSVNEASWYNGLDWKRAWNTFRAAENVFCSKVSFSNKTKLSSRSVVDRLLQTRTGASFGKWYGGTSIHHSGSCFSLDALWSKLTHSLDCPSLLLLGCSLIDAAVPCKEVVHNDDCLLMLLKELVTLSSLEETSYLFCWPQLQFCQWILKAGTIDVLILLQN